MAYHGGWKFLCIGGCCPYCHRKGAIHQRAWLGKCECQKLESIFYQIIWYSLNV
jgi:hypothetical protein